MARYVEKVKAFLTEFATVRVELVPREENALTDSLSKIVTERAKAKGVHFIELVRKDKK